MPLCLNVTLCKLRQRYQGYARKSSFRWARTAQTGNINVSRGGWDVVNSVTRDNFGTSQQVSFIVGFSLLIFPFWLMTLDDSQSSIAWELVAPSGNVNLARTHLGCDDREFYRFVGQLRFTQLLNLVLGHACRIMDVLNRACSCMEH